MARNRDLREDSDEDDFEDEYDRPSKSQIKRELQALQDLGKEMTKLGAETLNRIPLPEDVREAIDEYAKMKSFGAQRRQLQLIGKRMNGLDPERVRQAIDLATGESRAAVAAHHKAERLRDKLLAEDAFLTEFIQTYPSLDVQSLRQTIRSARREAATGKPPKSARELYRIIYPLVSPNMDLAKPAEETDTDY
ncbi:MAG TPA: DUF615 domain-containing protein [Candidatus Aphodousia faecipullorum]|nr:DUF615 domain-containing protein [Candidatus Aphodousia faecipullorum]